MSFASETQEKIEVMQVFVNGRPIEYRRDGAKNWEPCPVPVWDWMNYDYRAKPLTPDYIDWSPIAPRFEFCARDADGEVYVYAEEPYITHSDSTSWTGIDATRIDKFWQGIFTQGDIPWQDSLLMRNDGGAPMIRQVLHEDVTPEMVDVLHTDYLRKSKSARECAIRIMNMYDGLKANDPGAHKEAPSGQVYAINNLFLIKGWSATCAIKKMLQDLEDSRG